MRVTPNMLGKAIRVKLNVACIYSRVERGRSPGGGVNGLRRLQDPRHRSTAATMDGMALPSLKGHQKSPKRAWRHDQ